MPFKNKFAIWAWFWARAFVATLSYGGLLILGFFWAGSGIFFGFLNFFCSCFSAFLLVVMTTHHKTSQHITLTLPCITLDCIALDYIHTNSANTWLHYMTWHDNIYIILQYITCHYIPLLTITCHYIPLHTITYRTYYTYHTYHYIPYIPYIPYIALHYIRLFVALHYKTIHSIT